MSDQPTFRLNEGTLPLDVPGVWEDQTIHVLRLPGHGGATASLVVTRELLPVGQSPAEYQRRELERLRTTLPEFELRGRVPVDWPGRPGEALLTRWRAEPGVMDQITALWHVEGRRALIFTATHPSPMPSAAYETMLSAIAGFRPHPADPPASE